MLTVGWAVGWGAAVVVCGAGTEVAADGLALPDDEMQAIMVMNTTTTQRNSLNELPFI